MSRLGSYLQVTWRALGQRKGWTNASDSALSWTNFYWVATANNCVRMTRSILFRLLQIFISTSRAAKSETEVKVGKSQRWLRFVSSKTLIILIVLFLKGQLTPKYFLPLMKTTSFLYYFSEKIISIDKIPPILQAFKVIISCPTTEHGGIWVGPLLTSSKDIAQNTQETFDEVSSAVKTYLGYLCFMFSRNWTRLPNESVSSSNTIWSLSTISTAPIYIYIFFDFEVRVASRVRHTASHDRQFAGPFG